MMKKVLSHIATLLIASVMILATGGFSLYEHFCACQNEKHASLFAEGEHCCEDQSAVGSWQSAAERSDVPHERSDIGISSSNLTIEQFNNSCCSEAQELRSSEAQNCCSIESHLKTQNSKLNSEPCSGNCCDDEVKYFKLSEPYTFTKNIVEFKVPVKDVENDYHILFEEILEDTELISLRDRNGFFPPPTTIKRLSFLQQFKLSPPSFA